MGLHARRDSFSSSPPGRAVAAGPLMVACALALAACAATNPPPAAPSTVPSTVPSTGASVKTTPVTPTASPFGSPAAIGACAASQLKIGLTDTGAVAGQAGGYLEFGNDASTPCRITGWPAVTGLTAAGQATPLRRAQSTMFGAWRLVTPLPVLTLRPGQAAYAVVAADDLPAGSSPSCPPSYVRLRVSPPGSSASVVISAWLPGARSYLPACASASGSPTAENSAITPLSSLPH
jgi:hypothetical protein